MASSNAPLKILVVRPDRIGDVILSTPVFEVLKRHYPKSHLTVMVQEAIAPLVRGLPSVDDVIIFRPNHEHSGLSGLFRLIAEFRERDFRIAVVLQSHWAISAALFAARVRYRVGPRSKPHSFLFYNRGVRQRRSHVEMHEADYNLQLLRRLGIRVGTRNVPVRVSSNQDAEERAAKWLADQGWAGDTEASRLIAVHPGMGGSALNWPEQHYLDLIRSLVKAGHRVLVTAGPMDHPILEQLKVELTQQSERVRYYGGKSAESADVLAALYRRVGVVVAPSTGPLHIAVAVGRPVVTFYPPIRVQSAIRWAPYLADESKASILVPEVYCGQDFECAGNLCNYYPCMKTLTVSQALEKVQQQLAHSLGELKNG